MKIKKLIGLLIIGLIIFSCKKDGNDTEDFDAVAQAIEDDNMSEIEDALGDILVTIIIQAEMQGLKLTECLESAYNVIAKRTGKMVDGQFVKDATAHSGFNTEQQSNT